jgi:hypothetical protein
VISSWLVKLVLGIALVGFALFELGSPLVTKALLDGQAHDIANEAAHEYFQNHDVGRARALAQQDADDDHAKLDAFDIDGQGTVHVTLSEQAKSYLLHNFGPTKDWYAVRISVTAVPK